jgi:Holliday junction DNA helicase RuvA
VPATVLQRLDNIASPEGDFELVTYHYWQLSPSTATPILIGFTNEIERDFFLQFITVSGIGPRAAVKAINKPISDIVRAIDVGDVNYLKTLPGIGAQRAKEIVAKLQGKIGKFGLIRDKVNIQVPAPIKEDWQKEALEVLLQLQYKKQEAVGMIEKAIDNNPEIGSAEELLNEIYKQRTKF